VAAVTEEDFLSAAADKTRRLLYAAIVNDG
jgi:hypothetical protein